MASSKLRKAVQDLRGLVQQDDGHLLDRFLKHRDEAAFADIVRRHGSLVWGVCRRLLGHHDAEDAFQATFLVLARKANCVRPACMLANWLHGVAERTALKARASAGRRRRMEQNVVSMPEPATAQQDGARELERVIDGALAWLPEKYRVAIILCDLQCRTGKEAAQQLQIPEGTLSSRLRTARTMLATRLGRHGEIMSAGALALLSQNASASAAVLARTIEVAAGQTTAPPVVALAEGVLKAMFLSRLKMVAALIFAVGLIGFTGAVLTYHPAAADQQEVAPTAAERRTEAIRQERKRFAGTWQLVAVEMAGEKLPLEEIGKGLRAKMHWLSDMEGRRRESPKELRLILTYDADGNWKRRIEGHETFTYMNGEGVSTIDPAKDPPTIDDLVTGIPEGHEAARKADIGAAQKGQIRRGIYQFIDANTYRICFAAPNKERPTGFSKSKDDVVWVLQRVTK